MLTPDHVRRFPGRKTPTTTWGRATQDAIVHHHHIPPLGFTPLPLDGPQNQRGQQVGVRFPCSVRHGLPSPVRVHSGIQHALHADHPRILAHVDVAVIVQVDRGARAFADSTGLQFGHLLGGQRPAIDGRWRPCRRPGLLSPSFAGLWFFVPTPPAAMTAEPTATTERRLLRRWFFVPTPPAAMTAEPTATTETRFLRRRFRLGLRRRLEPAAPKLDPRYHLLRGFTALCNITFNVHQWTKGWSPTPPFP